MTKRIEQSTKVEKKEIEIRNLINTDFEKLLKILEKFRNVYDIVHTKNSPRRGADIFTNSEFKEMKNDIYLIKYKTSKNIENLYYLDEADFKSFYFQERLKDYDKDIAKIIALTTSLNLSA
ncbi:hypothetical protein H0A43_03375 [Arcobacter lanthieri]|uniref:hypothetical protein n=1 Tax=Aliarcobacter lanthieri TaxID=1355374 RepID=UPI001924C07B|nr:hypothetical protein [Aliarcobacter lanthieri]MBL3519498.1 hypothetical protein [Aliarcobacter lanthieri]